MNVFTTHLCHDADGEKMLFVHSTEEKAIAAMHAHNAGCHGEELHHYVDDTDSFWAAHGLDIIRYLVRAWEVDDAK